MAVHFLLGCSCNFALLNASTKHLVKAEVTSLVKEEKLQSLNSKFSKVQCKLQLKAETNFLSDRSFYSRYPFLLFIWVSINSKQYIITQRTFILFHNVSQNIVVEEEELYFFLVSGDSAMIHVKISFMKVIVSSLPL